MRGARRVSIAAAALAVGCGARTGLLVPPEATDATVDAHDALDAAPEARDDSRVDVDEGVDVTIDASDVADANDVADASLDAPETFPPIVEIALVVLDPSGDAASLALADAATGAVLHRGPPTTTSIADRLVVSPDTLHAITLVTSGAATPDLVSRFDVPTTLGAHVAGFDHNYVVGGRWSHDSRHLCLLTFRGAFIESVDATDGGAHVPVPLDKDTFPLDCMWSHDDAFVAWRYQGPTSVYVTPVDGSSAVEVAHAPASTFDGELDGWSPTESRLAFALRPTVDVDFQLFTADLSGAPIEIDDHGGQVIEWTLDGKSIAYRGWSGASGNHLRLAPVVGPLGAAIDLASAASLGDFTPSADGAWIAYGVAGSSGTSDSVNVTSITGATRTLATGSAHAFVWSSKGSFAFVLVGPGGDVPTIYDPASGASTRIDPPITGGTIDALAWAPDGSQLAYARTPVSGPGRICVFTLASLAERCTSPLGAAAPLWSSDGRWLAFGGGGGVLVMSASDLSPHAIPLTNVQGWWWVRP